MTYKEYKKYMIKMNYKKGSIVSKKDFEADQKIWKELFTKIK